jgi:hypothetical protein
VELIPVAAPTHPLATGCSHPPGAARNFIQLVLTDRSALTKGRDFSVIAGKDVAPRGPECQACVASGWHRLGPHARADGPRRSCGRALETGRAVRAVRWFLYLRRHLPHRHSAGACSRLDDSALFPTGGIRRATAPSWSRACWHQTASPNLTTK